VQAHCVLQEIAVQRVERIDASPKLLQQVLIPTIARAVHADPVQDQSSMQRGTIGCLREPIKQRKFPVALFNPSRLAPLYINLTKLHESINSPKFHPQ
jgi:hypothetical protein